MYYGAKKKPEIYISGFPELDALFYIFKHGF
ncbi:hypothetical protein F957_02418 [Acinetobacter gyllenbergii CIP 110306 = MTCC 11365]|uniref:Uncharacterized protein n=1 Tax=Acinetobacter gyllenbergii CIP 110306 = MTCC 11365 TaxID=1217657 RepID=A0A829HGM1_9GAMM|nr:hypothetical protein F957_02418 [Acinetobacter gyllenbergii CIP 110306 = MTCC 11365]